MCAFLRGWSGGWEINQAKQLRSGLENNCVSFVSGNDAVELSKILGLTNGYGQLFHLKGAGIVDNAAVHYGFGVITGEAEVGIDGGRQVIDHVPGRTFDFKRIRITSRSLEFDGELPRLFGLQEP